MPEISVIIPVYNKEAYIEKSLHSVLEQSFTDLEVIAVNDGSTDHSLEILQRLASQDARISVIDIPNGGVSNARNTGLTHARGKWIQFLDADDWLEEEYLLQAMQTLKQNPADILFSGFSMVDEQMNLVKEVVLPEKGIRNQRELCECFIRYQYQNGFFGYISNKLFRRALLNESGARFPVGTKLAEDLHFYARLYPAVKSAYFWPGKSFQYLQTSSNYLHESVIDYYSQIQIHLDIKDWFMLSGLYSDHRQTLDGMIASYAYFILFYDYEEKKDVSAAFTYLCSREGIMRCIDSNYMNGFAKKVLWCLKRRSLTGIKLLLAGRSGIRTLYRTVKRV